MTALAAEIRVRCPIPLGINVLRNDGLSALAVAVASHASFIRVNVLCGARIADQGLLQGIAHELLRERANLNARSLQIWADVDVKHSAAITARPIEEEVHDMVDRSGCDALIVSGTATGRPTDLETVRAVKTAAGHTPVLIGSGVTAESVPKLVKFSDALIVGTSLKRDGLARGPVELDRVRQLVQAVRTARP